MKTSLVTYLFSSQCQRSYKSYKNNGLTFRTTLYTVTSNEKKVDAFSLKQIHRND